MNDKMNLNASHTDAERHYFGKDHLGSVRAVTNQWGSPLYMFDYMDDPARLLFSGEAPEE